MLLLLSSFPQQSNTSLPRAPSSLTLIGLSVLLLLMTRATAATASMGVNSLLMGFQMSASGVIDKRASGHQHHRATSTVLGTAAPAITLTGDSKRPFGVENNTFIDYPSARQRSCGDQFNICQLMANTDKTVDFSVSECQNQQTSCLNVNQAVIASSSSTSSSSSSTSTRTSTSESTTTTSSTTSTSTSTSFSTLSTSTSTSTSTSISTSTSTTSPLITSATLASLTQPPTPQQTTITQGDFILICDL